MTRILAVANQKGGVGKTTTSINLATALAASGKTVLILDFDPQGNASTSLGITPQARKNTAFDLMIEGVSLSACIHSTIVPNLTIIPGDESLAGLEADLSQRVKRAYVLRDVLNEFSFDLLKYDYVFIDCPPSLSTLTINALTAADAILVPLQCEFLALEGLSQLMQTVKIVKSTTNPSLEIQGLVLTMFDQRNSLSGQVADEVRSHFGDKVYDTMIPRNVRLSEAPSFGKPALIYDMKCAGSQAYINLASEVIRREQALAS